MSAEPRVLLEFETDGGFRWRIIDREGLQAFVASEWIGAGIIGEGVAEAVALAVYDAMRAREVRE